ncbi:MAG: DUF1289 domain-containing protein [Methylotenera sp.]|uniref:DUF1289 domain-containing protein n=1 Tax=Methylotenera sp. TaxID=2051956 RepID=UPI0017C8C667|nr:DUF1289 domain-containing protein [Methylotenera sp.]NOU24269.1 DUF1289 domain-containing protein [Methylotenera sp.]
MTNEAESEVASPCIGVCAVDETAGLCQGCYRTIDEIKTWWDKTNAEKIELLKSLELRVEQSFD